MRHETTRLTTGLLAGTAEKKHNFGSSYQYRSLVKFGSMIYPRNKIACMKIAHMKIAQMEKSPRRKFPKPKIPLNHKNLT